jgi:hypothetical protein
MLKPSVAKFRGEVFAYFHSVAVKCHISMRNWPPEQILCEQFPWCQRTWWACSWLCSLPGSPFSASVSFDMSFKFSCTAHAFIPKRLSNHCQRLLCTFFYIYSKFDAVPLSDISRNRIRPDTRLQLKGRKSSTLRPSCVKFCTLTPNICYYYLL